jgi:hypothetical protein
MKSKAEYENRNNIIIGSMRPRRVLSATRETIAPIEITSKTASRAANCFSSKVTLNLDSTFWLKNRDTNVMPRSAKGMAMSKYIGTR